MADPHPDPCPGRRLEAREGGLVAVRVGAGREQRLDREGAAREAIDEPGERGDRDDHEIPGGRGGRLAAGEGPEQERGRGSEAGCQTAAAGRALPFGFAGRGAAPSRCGFASPRTATAAAASRISRKALRTSSTNRSRSGTES